LAIRGDHGDICVVDLAYGINDNVFPPVIEPQFATRNVNVIPCGGVIGNVLFKENRAVSTLPQGTA
jgi:hypothetical protein